VKDKPVAPENRDTSPAPIYTIGLDRANVLRLTAYSVGLLFLSAGVFSAVVGNGGGDAVSIGVGPSLAYVAVYFATLFVHELVHGAAFRIFGGRPRYGAGFTDFMPYCYATSSGTFSVRQMIVIGLAPLLTISTLSLGVALLAPPLVGYLAVVFIGNTAGAVADIWMAGSLMRFRAVEDATVVDTRESIAVYSRDPKTAGIVTALRARDDKPAGFLQHWVIATLGVFALTVLISSIGPFFTNSILIGPRELPLIMFTMSEARGPEWSFSLYPAVIAGFLFAVAARLFTRLASRGQASKPVE
jgi:hypothetical protein